MRHSLAVLLALVMLLAIGCSGGTPTTPTGTTDSQPAPDTQDYQVLSSGTMNLDEGTVEPYRDTEAYFNVTGFIGSNFSYTINGWVEPGVLDITLSLTNASPWAVFDVSIVFEQLLGKEVVNNDGFIDIYGPLDLDPLIAFGKGNPGREFLSGTTDLQPLHLTFPGGGVYVDYFIIAHLGGNTGGVWELANWTVTGQLTPAGGSADLSVMVEDYQDDVTSVLAETSALTGGLTFFSKNPAPGEWGATISNTMGAPVGEYEVIVQANSPAAPGYSYYRYFMVPVEQGGQAEINPLFNKELDQGDTGWDIGVKAQGPVYVLMDHPATGNVGGDGITGTRTALEYTNDLTSYVVLNPGFPGIADLFWDAPNPTFQDFPNDVNRIDVGVGGDLVANVGHQCVASIDIDTDGVTLIGNSGFYLWCGVSDDYDITCLDVANVLQPLGDMILGVGELSDPCPAGVAIPSADWILGFYDPYDSSDPLYDYSADAHLALNSNLVGIEGLDAWGRTLFFLTGPDENCLAVVDTPLMLSNGLLLNTKYQEGTFAGDGLDVAINSGGDIVTLETPGVFRKFDDTYVMEWTTPWIGNGTAMRIDFDYGDDKLYVLSDTHITACSVN